MREEFAPQPSDDDTRVALAESARETDMKIAVQQMHRKAAKTGMRITDSDALRMVEQAIETDGVAAVLPRFAAINERNGAVWSGEVSGERPESPSGLYRGRQRRTTVGAFPFADGAPAASQSDSEDTAAYVEKMKADYAAGIQEMAKNPSPELGKRLDYMQSQLKKYK